MKLGYVYRQTVGFRCLPISVLSDFWRATCHFGFIRFFSNHIHQANIVDYRVFAKAQEQRKHRTSSNYRGIKKYKNAYSGFLVCGDCGAPMFSMSRSDLKPAYICGSYHRRERKGCTSHHTRVDLLDDLLKRYIRMVKENSADMLEQMNAAIQNESTAVKHNEETSAILQR